MRWLLDSGDETIEAEKFVFFVESGAGPEDVGIIPEGLEGSGATNHFAGIADKLAERLEILQVILGGDNGHEEVGDQVRNRAIMFAAKADEAVVIEDDAAVVVEDVADLFINEGPDGDGEAEVDRLAQRLDPRVPVERAAPKRGADTFVHRHAPGIGGSGEAGGGERGKCSCAEQAHDESPRK